MKVWITKYALSSGILEVEGRVVEESSTGMLAYKRRDSSYEDYVHGEGRDWHRTLEGAIDRAKEMRTAQILSLHKSIRRLEGLTFDSESNPVGETK